MGKKTRLFAIIIIIVLIVGLTFIVVSQFTKNKITTPPPVSPIQPTQKSTGGLPQTNPFEVKTNPFKNIKTNPFR